MKKNRIYISGPITDIENGNFDEFDKAEFYYTQNGYIVENPHRSAQVVRDVAIDMRADTPAYRDFLAYNIMVISECDIMVVLPGYKESKGSQFEVAFAAHCNIPIHNAYSDKPLQLKAQVIIVTDYNNIENPEKIYEVLEDTTKILS